MRRIAPTCLQPRPRWRRTIVAALAGRLARKAASSRAQRSLRSLPKACAPCWPRDLRQGNRRTAVRRFSCGAAQAGQAISEYAVTFFMMAGMIAILSTDALPFFPYIIELFQRYLDGLHMVVTLPVP